MVVRKLLVTLGKSQRQTSRKWKILSDPTEMYSSSTGTKRKDGNIIAIKFRLSDKILRLRKQVLSTTKQLTALGARLSRQLHLTPKEHTDLPMVAHVFQQGDSDLPHGVRTKTYDIHGISPSVLCLLPLQKDKTGESHQEGAITNGDATLVAASERIHGFLV